jgi:hypothetical protein
MFHNGSQLGIGFYGCSNWVLALYRGAEQHNAGIDRARTQRINHASLADESRAIRAPVE